MARSLSEMLIAQADPAAMQNAPQKVEAGVNLGIQLATMQDAVQQKKMQTEAMKQQLLDSEAKFHEGWQKKIVFAESDSKAKRLTQAYQMQADRRQYPVTDGFLQDFMERRLEFKPQIQDALDVLGKFPPGSPEWNQVITAYTKLAGNDDAGLWATAYKEAIGFSLQGEKIEATKQAAIAASGRQDAIDRRQDNVMILSASKRRDAAKIPDMSRTFSEIENHLKMIKGGDIPGFGLGAFLQGNIPFINAANPLKLSSKAGRELRQSVDALKNLVLQARSGAAVTKNEQERLESELGVKAFDTDANLRQGLAHLLGIMYRHTKSIESGLNDRALAEWRDRGILGSSDPIFKSVINSSEFSHYAEPNGEAPAEAKAAAGPAPKFDDSRGSVPPSPEVNAIILKIALAGHAKEKIEKSLNRPMTAGELDVWTKNKKK